GEVWRRVMPDRVLAGVGLVAVRGHRLLVCLPRLALAEDAGRRGNAARNGVAVAVEPRDGAVPGARGRAGVGRQGWVAGGVVVGRGGGADVVVVGGRPELGGRGVDVGVWGRADDGVVAVVFHPNPDHVLVGRRRGPRAARPAGGHRRGRLAGDRGHGGRCSRQ